MVFAGSFAIVGIIIVHSVWNLVAYGAFLWILRASLVDRRARRYNTGVTVCACIGMFSRGMYVVVLGVDRGATPGEAHPCQRPLSQHFPSSDCAALPPVKLLLRFGLLGCFGFGFPRSLSSFRPFLLFLPVCSVSWCFGHFLVVSV